MDLYVDLSLLSQLRAEDGGSTYMWLNLYAVIYGINNYNRASITSVCFNVLSYKYICF